MASSFNELLEKVRLEHEHQIAELRNELLRYMARGSQDSCADERMAPEHTVVDLDAIQNSGPLQDHSENTHKQSATVLRQGSAGNHGSKTISIPSTDTLDSKHIIRQGSAVSAETKTVSIPSTGKLDLKHVILDPNSRRSKTLTNRPPQLSDSMNHAASSKSTAVVVTPLGSTEMVGRGCEPFRLWKDWTSAHKLGQLGHMPSMEDIEEESTINDDIVNNLTLSPSQMVLLHSIKRSCRLIISPNSLKRLSWEILGALILMYDLVTIPLQVFNYPSSTFLDIMSWTTLAYWTLDVPASFSVGYITDDGQLIMLFNKIARRYMKSWLVPDLVIISCDWLTLMYEKVLSDNQGPSWMNSLGLARLGKAFRSLRILRMLRLIRLQKMSSLMILLQDAVGAEWIAIVVGICKNVALILAINHFLACAWWSIGTTRVEGYSSWVEEHEFNEQPWGYQYWTSLHWSITQFTPGSMHVQPQNIRERAFAVIVLLFAMIVFSSFVSSVTNSMAMLFGRNSDDTHQQWILRKYMQQQGISRDLSARVNRYIACVLEAKRSSVQLRDVQFLSLLSGPLLDDLLFELHSTQLLVHPLFA
jgi:hypothetical protein